MYSRRPLVPFLKNRQVVATLGGRAAVKAAVVARRTASRIAAASDTRPRYLVTGTRKTGPPCDFNGRTRLLIHIRNSGISFPLCPYLFLSCSDDVRTNGEGVCCKRPAKTRGESSTNERRASETPAKGGRNRRSCQVTRRGLTIACNINKRFDRKRGEFELSITSTYSVPAALGGRAREMKRMCARRRRGARSRAANEKRKTEIKHRRSATWPARQVACVDAIKADEGTSTRERSHCRKRKSLNQRPSLGTRCSHRKHSSDTVYVHVYRLSRWRLWRDGKPSGRPSDSRPNCAHFPGVKERFSRPSRRTGEREIVGTGLTCFGDNRAGN